MYDRKILFICSDYESDADANGICIRNIVKQIPFESELYIISETKDSHRKEENSQNIHTIFIPSPLLKRMNRSGSLAHKLAYTIALIVHRFFALFTYPDVSPKRSRTVAAETIRIVEENNIDIVVGFYRPFESISAVLKAKEHNSNITAIAYHLDLLKEPNTSNRILKGFKNIKASSVTKDEIKLLDAVILPNSEEENYGHHPKIRYVGFPLYARQTKKEDKYIFDDKDINITYIGTLDSKNRNIKYLIDLIDEMCVANKRIVLHVWGRLADQETEEILATKDYVIYHGMLNNEYVFSTLCNSDYVVNVSNANTYNMIPSKIFQLFATGKGIINLCFDPRDKSLPYFNRYGHVYNVGPAFDKNGKEGMKIWMQANLGKIYNASSDFEMFTPEYFWKTLKSIDSDRFR